MLVYLEMLLSRGDVALGSGLGWRPSPLPLTSAASLAAASAWLLLLRRRCTNAL